MRRIAFCSVVVAACSTPPPPRTSPETVRNNARENASQDVVVVDEPPVAAALESALLAKVAEGTYGPYLDVDDRGGLVVWAERRGERRQWLSLTLGAEGAPAGAARELAPAADAVGLVALRRFAPAGREPGHMMLTTWRSSEGERVDAYSIGPGGALRVGPVPLSVGEAPIVWVDAVPIAGGMIALWAERHAGRADVFAVELGAEGQPKDKPARVVTGARAWQSVATADGAAVAAVVAKSEGDALGSVRLAFISAQGRADQVVDVSSSPTADADLDVARVRGGFVLGWSDHRDYDARVYLAAVDERGQLLGPAHPATPPLGDQSLLRLAAAAGAERAVVAWENVLMTSQGRRRVQVATVGLDARLGSARGFVEFAADDGSPEVAPTPAGGVAALTLAPMCAVGAPCVEDDWYPTFVELGPDLTPVASEPLRLSAHAGRAADLAWDVRCRAGGCLALAADAAAPAPVYLVKLAPTGVPFVAAGGARLPSVSPHARSVSAFARTDAISDLDAVRMGDGILTAWVTYFDPSVPYVLPKTPAPDGRYAPTRALLQLQQLGSEAYAPVTVSLRARSLGGVALAATADARQALLVWSALDNNQPQVFTTLVDAQGKKVQQRMLTRTHGEVNAADAVAVDDGWIVGWVDDRNGHPEVFVTKLDAQLRRSGPEHRLSRSVGTATGVALLRRGDEVFVARADARGQARGVATIYVSRVSTRDAREIGTETRVSEGSYHAHSPALSLMGGDVVVAWIEDAQLGGATSGRGRALIATLGQGGDRAREPVALDLGADVPRTISLECEPERCRVLLTVDSPSGRGFAALTWSATRVTRAERVVPLGGNAEDLVPPRMVGPDAFYADVAGSGVLLRRLTLAW